MSGIVQGVGFRWFVRDEAIRLGLTGNVRNLVSGEVEVYAEGEKKALTELTTMMKSGNGYSRIDRSRIEWSKATGEWKSFIIAI